MEALLDAILAAPDDDGPRLVYADALQAAGDPRGELIAVQCELARLGAWTGHASWVGDMIADLAAIDGRRIAGLRTREAKLLEAHAEAWCAELRAAEFGSSTRFRFKRGFIEHAEWWPDGDNAARLFALAPALRSVRVELKSDGSADSAFARAPHLQRLRRIETGGNAVRPVLENRRLTSIRELALRAERGDQVVEAARAAPWFARLESLSLSKMTVEVSLELVRASGPLVELHLNVDDDVHDHEDDEDFGDEVATIVETPRLAQLEILGVRACGAGREDAEAIASSLHRLRALCLADNRIGAAGCAALAGALRELRVLDLSNNKLGVTGWRALANGKGLDRLTELRLAKTTLTGDDSVRALVESPLLGRLRALNLRDNHISDEGAEALAASEQCKNLVTLDLVGNSNLTERGRAALTSSPHLRRCRINKSRSRR